MLQMYLSGAVWPPWLQLKCSLSILQPYIFLIQGLGYVLLIMCFGHGSHCAHKIANLGQNAANTPARKGGATLVAN